MNSANPLAPPSTGMSLCLAFDPTTTSFVASDVADPNLRDGQCLDIVSGGLGYLSITQRMPDMNTTVLKHGA